eukprot:CAMPEP_0185747562 /NCGR_PEP_ID=MMETSP1174-20130828/6181_1 /TAXON_ID=35687 /ORGANISM="Dictyocha speculum, Strain CCMP1381" /LENGTH=76 /DNA_ID=CAMNT_0028422791 /DNA_START=156 /DNA_END=386 /DNA_ORIENTATION=+
MAAEESSNRADFLKQSFTAAVGLAASAGVVNAEVGVEATPVNYEKRNINPGSIIKPAKNKGKSERRNINPGSILKK